MEVTGNSDASESGSDHTGSGFDEILQIDLSEAEQLKALADDEDSKGTFGDAYNIFPLVAEYNAAVVHVEQHPESFGEHVRPMKLWLTQIADTAQKILDRGAKSEAAWGNLYKDLGMLEKGESGDDVASRPIKYEAEQLILHAHLLMRKLEQLEDVGITPKSSGEGQTTQEG